MTASNVGAGDVRAPILFGEEHIVVDAESIRLGAMARAETFSETAQDLRAAHGAQERQLLLRAVLRSIGFDWLCYYRLTRIGESITRVLYFRAYSPPNWPKRYIEERYFEVDPRLAFALRHEWPLVWDLADLGATLTAPADADRLHRLLQDAERSGLRSGISFGVVSPRSLEHSVICFGSGNNAKGWIADNVVGQAYAVGLGLHEFLMQHAKPLHEDTHARALTQVQRQILEFITSGLSDKAIAEQLNMSPHNVDYHLRQLKKKYGAQNRVQLAYMAGRMFMT